MRWNSTYLMLETSSKFVPVFKRLLLDQNYYAYFEEVIKDKKTEGRPNVMHWDNAKGFLRFLGKFYTLTKKFSSSYYVASNFYFKGFSLSNES